MKLVAWNIQHGGGVRRERIVEEISAYDADVIALTEFRARPGEALCKAFRERGWPLVERLLRAGIRTASQCSRVRRSWRVEGHCPGVAEYQARWLISNCRSMASVWE